MSLPFKVISLSDADEDTATLLIDNVCELVRSEKWHTSKDLYENIFNKVKAIMRRHEIKSSMIFVVLKVFKIIREECSRVVRGNPELEAKTTNLLFAHDENEIETVEREDLKDFLMEALEIFSNELNECDSLIKETALKYIGSDEVIITYGYSDLVLSLLLCVAEKKGIYNVIVLDGDQSSTKGAVMAEKLAEKGVSVTLAPEKCSMALMYRAHKVLIDCETIFINGSALSKNGTSRICMDAFTCSVPIFVCSPLSKLSPLLSHTGAVLENDDEDNFVLSNDTEVIANKYISVFMTNIGSLEPSQMFSISKDNFCSEDVDSLLSCFQ